MLMIWKTRGGQEAGFSSSLGHISLDVWKRTLVAGWPNFPIPAKLLHSHFGWERAGGRLIFCVLFCNIQLHNQGDCQETASLYPEEQFHMPLCPLVLFDLQWSQHGNFQQHLLPHLKRESIGLTNVKTCKGAPYNTYETKARVRSIGQGWTKAWGRQNNWRILPKIFLWKPAGGCQFTAFVRCIRNVMLLLVNYDTFTVVAWCSYIATR